jgi:hypothetical protein
MSARKSFTPKQRLAVYGKTQGHCAYCGQEITIKQMQVDHIIAVGGANPTSARNETENLFPACRPCNYIKSTMSVEKFRQYIEFLPDTLCRNNVTYRNALRFGRVVEAVTPCVFYFEKIGLSVPTHILDSLYKERHDRFWNAPDGAESEADHE